MTQERMGLADYFEQTWKAREKLLDAAEKLTPEEWAREFEFSWKSMQLLFAHIIEVERSWMLEDIRGKKYEPESQDAIRSRYATPALTRTQGREVSDITHSVLAEYASATKLQETREAGGAEPGTRVQLTVEQILTHVFTHELRHQGQLQVILRLLRKKAPNADWF
jgi:uncharacterized damage-inducible protein DinB